MAVRMPPEGTFPVCSLDLFDGSRAADAEHFIKIALLGLCHCTPIYIWYETTTYTDCETTPTSNWHQIDHLRWIRHERSVRFATLAGKSLRLIYRNSFQLTVCFDAGVAWAATRTMAGRSTRPWKT